MAPAAAWEYASGTVTHWSLQSPEALLLVPLILGAVGIAICIGVMTLASWLERTDDLRLPRARVRRSLTDGR